MYQTIFSRRAEKAFLGLPTREAQRVKQAIEKLEGDPRSYSTIKLENVPVASYRYRVVNHRILFDIDDEAKVIEILVSRQLSTSRFMVAVGSLTRRLVLRTVRRSGRGT